MGVAICTWFGGQDSPREPSLPGQANGFIRGAWNTDVEATCGTVECSGPRSPHCHSNSSTVLAPSPAYKRQRPHKTDGLRTTATGMPGKTWLRLIFML